MKAYGADLKKEYDELNKNQTALRKKVEKRFKYLLKKSNDPYLDGFSSEKPLFMVSTETMLFVMMKVEENYVKQSRQLDMFENQ